VNGTRLMVATSAKVGSTCTAELNGRATTIQVARDMSVAAGDVLIVAQVGAEWFALGRGYAAAPTLAEPNDTPPDPNAAVQIGTLVIAPVETRSYRSGSWRRDVDDVMQGSYGSGGNHTGCAFYGAKPRSLAGAEVLSAEVRVRRPDRGGMYAPQATTLWLVTQTLRPFGAPTLTLSTAGPVLRRGTTDLFDVPVAWAQAMVDGTAGGLAIFDADGFPQVILSGTTDYGPAFTLTIRWKRG
jgi:hypothetical protein